MTTAFKDSYDWQELFGASGYTEPMPPEPVPPGSPVSIADFAIGDVEEVLNASEGEYDAEDWICVVRLVDGRFASVWGWCDYTGWD